MAASAFEVPPELAALFVAIVHKIAYDAPMLSADHAGLNTAPALKFARSIRGIVQGQFEIMAGPRA